MSSTETQPATSPAGTGVNKGGGATRPPGFMGPEAMLAYLRDRLENKLLDAIVAYGQLTVIVTPEAWVDTIRLCKTDPQLDCKFWEFLDAVDRGEDGFDVNCHVYSVQHRHDITVRSRVPGGREKPVMPTLTGVFRGADWSERETYDMFGIEFEGHPGLLPRILTIESFEGWPLRKDFQLTTRNAKPWPGAKEPEERKEGGEEEAAGSATAATAPVEPEDKAEAAKAKAERAKAKAAAMRAKKAAERAEAQSAAAASDQAVASDAQQTTSQEAESAAAAEPADDTVADAAEQYGGGDTEGEAAAAAATAAGDPTASTPEGAAEVADSAVAKDASAGAAQGDVDEGAPQDTAGRDEPVVNAEGEAAAAQGAPPVASGTPGTEAEGRHGGAEQQSATQTPDDEDDVGVDRAAPHVADADDAESDDAESQPTQEAVQPGGSPSESERTDAADRADPARDLGSDAAPTGDEDTEGETP